MTMMNRRQFVYAAAAGAAMLTRASERVRGDEYDLIIKGGRVIDPSLRLDAIRDVAIAGGRIAAVEANIAADAAETIDARGKLVVPGLHRHPHPRRPHQRGPGALPRGRRDGVDRRGIAGRRSHRRHGCRREVGAAAGPRADQHRARRHPARRRHDGHHPRRCRRGARRDREEPRHHRRRQGAAVERRRRRQRFRGAEARAGSRPRPSICR